VLWGILILGAGLRLVGIGAPLTSDELASCSIWAQMPLNQIPVNYQYPNNHIFLTLLMSLILKTAGVNEVLLRLPVWLCGMASLILAYAAVLVMTRTRAVAQATAFLLAVSPAHVYYSTNARGYLLILVAAQSCFWILLKSLKSSETAAHPVESAKPSPGAGQLAGFALLGFLGTWTVPTFALFPAAVGLFLAVAYAGKKKLSWFAPGFSPARLWGVLVLGAGLFYVQYFVWIPGEMLKIGLANAAVGSLDTFFRDVPAEWVRPWDAAGGLTAVLAFFGVWRLRRVSAGLTALLAGILLFPVLGIYIAGALKLLPTVPPARTFFFLQPFFITTGVYGFFELAKLVCSSFNNRIPEIPGFLPAAALALVSVLFAGFSVVDLKKNIFPERRGREPWPAVLKFMQALGPNDLVLASNRSHVPFYLYGAGEMRTRVQNIVDTGRLDALYFVEYVKDGASDMVRVKRGAEDWVRLEEYAHAVDSGASVALEFPLSLLAPAGEFGNIRFHKVAQPFIRAVSGLNSADDGKNWTVHEGEARLEPITVGGAVRPAFRFHDVFAASAPLPQPPGIVPRLNIHLMSAKAMVEYSALHSGAKVANGALAFADAWAGNAWVMDHPYGPTIFRREWRTEIFLSLPTGWTAASVRTQPPGGEGWARGLLTLQIFQTPELNPGADGGKS
jgi:hypothetical protein